MRAAGAAVEGWTSSAGGRSLDCCCDSTGSGWPFGVVTAAASIPLCAGISFPLQLAASTLTPCPPPLPALPPLPRLSSSSTLPALTPSMNEATRGGEGGVGATTTGGVRGDVSTGEVGAAVAEISEMTATVGRCASVRDKGRGGEASLAEPPQGVPGFFPQGCVGTGPAVRTGSVSPVAYAALLMTGAGAGAACEGWAGSAADQCPLSPGPACCFRLARGST